MLLICFMLSIITLRDKSVIFHAYYTFLNEINTESNAADVTAANLHAMQHAGFSH
jgi:hypothetical protein